MEISWCSAAVGCNLLVPPTSRGYGCRVSCLTDGLWTNGVVAVIT
jgi:hypothetical protein